MFAAQITHRLGPWCAAGRVSCVRQDETTAELRMPLVEPSARGLRLGRRLVDECLRHARAEGCEPITPWTRDPLVSARRQMWARDLGATS
ncbi:GNAT family N-acetyltransferase [Nonomuraea sp. LP-02]|uniref:GNAT family N-acetyltransferase n=1 Tax=Nonomuraea sp. LP-02 TaxID=3097960 RepID=UPI002E3494EF|nr:GNAT family N-acetyltransferase [Nonomuraea sp. LP-02]MED7931186.1 GNAT family N-acetyltransferase [Nonomuraea sp. LP-02]